MPIPFPFFPDSIPILCRFHSHFMLIPFPFFPDSFPVLSRFFCQFIGFPWMLGQKGARRGEGVFVKMRDFHYFCGLNHDSF